MRRRGIARVRGILVLGMTGLWVFGVPGRLSTRAGKPAASHSPPPVPPPRARQPAPAQHHPPLQVAFLREGNAYVVDACGGRPRRLSRGGRFTDLDADGPRLALTPGEGETEAGISVLSAPGWRRRSVNPGNRFLGVSCWIPGTAEMVAARGDDSGGDLGWDLWRIDTVRRTRRRMTRGIEADVYPQQLLVSPGGRRVATLGLMTNTLFIHVVELRTGRRLGQAAARGIPSGTGAAWLDEESLLVAASPGEPFWGRGGVRRLDLRTGRLTPWLFSSRAQVRCLVGSPSGDRFAGVMGPSAFLVDAATRKLTRLQVPGSPLEFSPDGRQLLFWKQDLHEDCGEEGPYGDLYLFDVASRQWGRLVRSVNSAVWVQAALPVPAAPRR